MRSGKALERQTREGDVSDRENNEWRCRVVDRGLHRQQRARRASRIVVRMMQVGPALFSVRDRARFIARQRQGSAHDSHLADQGQ
ncbi:MAG TPA: hypothetical protein VJ825_09340 [Gemmatimonadaceae bacterium]|nr:hypothetical protein [Gemmatimonadaceae bacterium]